MTAFCTHCSKNKDHAAALLPAIERYSSPRIRQVYEAARCVGADFFILSGEFGLLPPDAPIPDYDHLLQPNEVETLSVQVGNQISACAIEQLIYFTEDAAADKNLMPYSEVMQKACQRACIALCIVEMNS